MMQLSSSSLFHSGRLQTSALHSTQKSLPSPYSFAIRASQASVSAKSATLRASSLGSAKASTRTLAARALALPSDPRTFPADFNLVDVKTYGAKGDGITDDTAAIRAALAAGRSPGVNYFGRPKALYFPAGTYLVSNTLNWIGCCVNLQGAGRGTSIIKLKDGTTGFNDPTAPKAVIKTPGGNMSFRQYIQDLTVNTGTNNAGAIGIDYISNNVGSIDRVNIQSGDGKGYSGLDMSRQWPGPLLIKDVSVDGFDRGIYVKNAEYGPTFKNITLSNQNLAGILNEGNTLAIEKLTSTNSVPAIKNTASFGSVIVLNSTFNGGAANTSAIVNNGYLYARGISAQGYTSAISNKGSTVSGLSKTEYVSGNISSLFPSPQKSLGLPIETAPFYEDQDLTKWAKFSPRYYGDTSPLQSALDSGKSTVYFPFGNYFSYSKKVFTVPATVQRIVGLSSIVNTGPGGGIVFRVEGNTSRPLVIEQFGYGISVEHNSSRPVVLEDGSYNYKDSPQAGKLFLEDVSTGSLNINYPHSVWARQLNIEGPQTKITNNGGKLWILGLKTEGAGPVIRTTGGGKTELLGSLIYPATSFSAAQLQEPAFLNEESSQSLIYSVSAYAPNNNYKIQVREVRNKVTRDFFSNQLSGSRMPLFVGYR